METKGILLDRKALLAKEELQVVKVTFEDDNFVYVRQMTGHERDAFEQSMLRKIKDKKDAVTGYESTLDDFRAKLAVVTLCDEKGNLLLEPSDYLVLSTAMTAKKLETIVNKAQEINKITDEDKEELLKNSVAGLEDNSSSGSAKN